MTTQDIPSAKIDPKSPYEAKIFDTFCLTLVVASKFLTLPLFLSLIISFVITLMSGNDFKITSHGLVFSEENYTVTLFLFWAWVILPLLGTLSVLGKVTGVLSVIAIPFNAVEVFFHNLFAKRS